MFGSCPIFAIFRKIRDIIIRGLNSICSAIWVKIIPLNPCHHWHDELNYHMLLCFSFFSRLCTLKLFREIWAIRFVWFWKSLYVLFTQKNCFQIYLLFIIFIAISRNVLNLYWNSVKPVDIHSDWIYSNKFYLLSIKRAKKFLEMCGWRIRLTF